jgi:hypothetical protein
MTNAQTTSRSNTRIGTIDRIMAIAFVVVAVLFRPSGALIGSPGFGATSQLSWGSLVCAALWLLCSQAARRGWRWQWLAHAAVSAGSLGFLVWALAVLRSTAA